MKSWFWLIFNDYGVSKVSQERSELMNAFFSTTRSASPPLLQIMLDWWKIQPTSVGIPRCLKKSWPFWSERQMGAQYRIFIFYLFRVFAEFDRCFAKVLQDRFGNYIVQRVIETCSGPEKEEVSWRFLELDMSYVMKSTCWMMFYCRSFLCAFLTRINMEELKLPSALAGDPAVRLMNCPLVALVSSASEWVEIFSANHLSE